MILIAIGWCIFAVLVFFILSNTYLPVMKIAEEEQ